MLTVAALSAAAPVPAQGRISNAQTERRSAAQALDREVRAIASRPVATWIGYHVPMVAGHRQMCCSDSVPDAGKCCGMCRLESGSGVAMTRGSDDRETGGSRIMLEPPSEFNIFARVEGGVVGRIRTFTPDCDVDAGGMPLVWLDDVNPASSVAWLSSLVLSVADATTAGGAEDAAGRDHLAKPSVAAIALHNVAAADRALESFVAPIRPEWLRSNTAFWLGSTRGDAGAQLLARMIAQDPSDKVRDRVAFALSVSRVPSSLATLIATAKADRSARVRGQALFWLAHRAGEEAVAAIATSIETDPDTAVKKKAVFALSQLPRDEGVPKLIEVARTNHNPEVRRQAFFWLGQSRDSRAEQFFEEVLLNKQPATLR
jgi:hypothetical protein